MGVLINGKWSTDWYKSDKQGHFVRPETQFRDWVRADGSSPYQAEADRYHLYVSYACPWAHRTLIMRKLKGLEEAIGLSVVDPLMRDEGWRFSKADGCIPDTVNDVRLLSDLYIKAVPHYSGRVTVPVLWDKKKGTIVNNESREILRMFDREFDAIATNPISFGPAEKTAEIDNMIDQNYDSINNGVYRSGFATSQGAYDESVQALFLALDRCESILADRRYLCGNRITEADWCLFTTLLRFDLVYFGHFKCNKRRIQDYPNLWNYLKELFQYPGISETCDFGHIKSHYYWSHPSINPHRIIPIGPDIDFSAPYDRDHLADE